MKVVFYVYYGMFVTATQVNFTFWAPPEDARKILNRLHRINVTWGLTAYGVVAIPFLSGGTRRSQLKSIQRQQTELAAENRKAAYLASQNAHQPAPGIDQSEED